MAEEKVSELLGCPFCGDPPVVRRIMEDYPAEGGHPAGQYEARVNVCCDTCGFELGEEFESEAVAAWNRRPTPVTEDVGGWVMVPRAPTHEMEHAALLASRACTELPDGFKPLPHGYDGWSAAFVYRAMLSASPSPPKADGPGEVRVKPLEWQSDDHEEDVRTEWYSAGIVGQYLAHQRDGDWRLVLDYISGDEVFQTFLGAFDTDDAAKRAAQSDYEARIWSALVSPSIKREG